MILKLTFITHALLVAVVVYQKIKHKPISNDIFSYIVFSFLIVFAFSNFRNHTQNASNSLIYNTCTIPIMLLSRNVKLKYLFMIMAVLKLFTYVHAHYHWSNLYQTYFFGIETLLFTWTLFQAKVWKRNDAENIIRIFILVFFAFGVYFVGYTHHPQLWLQSQFQQIVFLMFASSLSLFYALTTYYYATL